MSAFLIDEALALRLSMEAAHAAKGARLPEGMTLARESDYDDPLPPGPVVPGPAADLVRSHG